MIVEFAQVVIQNILQIQIRTVMVIVLAQLLLMDVVIASAEIQVLKNV